MELGGSWFSMNKRKVGLSDPVVIFVIAFNCLGVVNQYLV